MSHASGLFPFAHQGGPAVSSPARTADRKGTEEAMRPISRRVTMIGAVALALPICRADAQDYPSRSVTIVAPSAPGGMYSILARLIASKLEARYGKSFVVENRPGASSVTGSVAVVRATPDGYTLMTAASTTLATNVSLHRSLPYNPLTDFVPPVLLARS